jgi:uncharacterized protein (TIGR02466 family)
LAAPKVEFGEAKLIFPLPLVSYRLPDAEELNASLLAEIETRREAEEGVARSNRMGWHSNDDFFNRTEPAHREIAQRIIECIGDATRRVASPKRIEKVEFQLQGWININPPDAYNVPHEHPGSFWSGSYYVLLEHTEHPKSEDGAISFLDSRCAPAGQGLMQTKVFKSTHTERPTAGTVLLFPSTLKHWVHPNRSGKDRVTLAFNAIPKVRGQS